jgi:5-oxopent-3-ene-1,2,5-tricarboxylate decarboxylase/2-hydroxyhepta-2,4-diene-1,7-dioate isomerase
MANGEISQTLIDRYKKVTSATVYGGVRRLGYEPCFMRGVESFTPGAKLVGRARTLRFIPPRPDIMKETHRGADSPEYQAMGSCGPGDVLVVDGMGRKYAAIGGDVKLLQLKMVGGEGMVTDASIRDLEIVADYGLKIFAGGRTPMGGAGEIDPYEANVTIQCGGVAVRPGDLIVADDDGVVVVPNVIASEVIDWVEEHEAVEEYIKELIQKEKVAPGKYYPITDETIKRFHQERG